MSASYEWFLDDPAAEVLVILFTSTDIRNEVIVAGPNGFPDCANGFPGKWGSREAFLNWAGPGARWASGDEAREWVERADAVRAAHRAASWGEDES